MQPAPGKHVHPFGSRDRGAVDLSVLIKDKASASLERAEQALAALEAALPSEDSDARGPRPTPPGASRLSDLTPGRSGITFAPRVSARKAARAARRRSRVKDW